MSEKPPREFEDWWKEWIACPRCEMDSSMRTAASNAWHLARFDVHMQNQLLREERDAARNAIELRDADHAKQIQEYKAWNIRTQVERDAWKGQALALEEALKLMLAERYTDRLGDELIGANAIADGEEALAQFEAFKKENS